MKNENYSIPLFEEKLVASNRMNEDLEQDAEQVVDDSKNKKIIYQYTSSRLQPILNVIINFPKNKELKSQNT